MNTSTLMRRSDAGLSALEMTISTAILGLAFSLYGGTFTSAMNVAHDVTDHSEVQEVGRDSIQRIAAELSASGRHADEFDGSIWPRVFGPGLEDENIPEEFLAFSGATSAYAADLGGALNAGAIVNDAATTAAASGLGGILGGAPGDDAELPEETEPNSTVLCASMAPVGVIRQLAYRVPRDLDGDGTPYDAATGKLEWAPERRGLLLRPDAHGTFDLIRRRLSDTGEVRDRVICHHVEALTLDTRETNNLLPRNAVQINLRLRRTDAKGRVLRHHASTTVLMRNSEE